MTKQERHLWYDFLKNQGLHWTKQKTMGDYILDFYCHSVKLAIELDGSQHYEQDKQEYDKRRTDFLNQNGIKVLRFTNIDVDQRFEGVCGFIEHEVSIRKQAPSVGCADSSPRGGAF
ncbi:MAG: endonuclease domain-containing protein [Lachnospiraceae bacterium]|nr:endonuclease domain-containing protein [Lachnospiraceae bacterium]